MPLTVFFKSGGSRAKISCYADVCMIYLAGFEVFLGPPCLITPEVDPERKRVMNEQTLLAIYHPGVSCNPPGRVLNSLTSCRPAHLVALFTGFSYMQVKFELSWIAESGSARCLKEQTFENMWHISVFFICMTFIHSITDVLTIDRPSLG